MKLYIYFNSLNEKKNKNEYLPASIQTYLPNWDVQHITSLQKLTKILKTPQCLSVKLLILRIETEAEIDFLLDKKDIYTSQKLVFILNNPSEKLMSKSHQLTPRIIFYEDFGFKNMCAVIMRMASKEKPLNRQALAT